MANVAKKIYIDSRFSEPDSTSNTDFKYNLVDSVHIPDNTKMFVTDVCIPRTWYTIEYFNHNLLVRMRNDKTKVVTDYKIQLSHKNYTLQTLAQEVELKLKNTIRVILWSVEPEIETGRFIIDPIDNRDYAFWILSDADVSKTGTAYVNTLGIDPSNPQTCNSILGITGHRNFMYRWESGIVDVVGIHNVYITCSQFGNNSIGPRGERNILKKIVTDADFGGLIVYNWEPYYDNVDCGNILIKHLHFRLTDAYGNVIPLHGAHVSFTLIFCPKD